MQKHNLFSLIMGIMLFLISETVMAGIISLPRYTGEFAYRTQSGGRNKPEISCTSKGGVEKGTNQTCTGPFSVGGKICYKECHCDTSVFKYTEAVHKGDGKLCTSLSNACIIDGVTKYSVCKLNTCNKQNSEWIGANNKTTYTSKNYQCTEQSISGSDGVCNKCMCPSAWATGSCPTVGVKSCQECPKTDPYTVAKFNLESCLGGYKKENNGCTQCSSGTYAAVGSSVCSSCPKGSYSSSAGASSCTYCPAGYEPSGKTGATSQSEACKICGYGYYKVGANANSCTQCPNGQTTEKTGSTSKDACFTACTAKSCTADTACGGQSCIIFKPSAIASASELGLGIGLYESCSPTNCSDDSYQFGYLPTGCASGYAGYDIGSCAVPFSTDCVALGYKWESCSADKEVLKCPFNSAKVFCYQVEY